jgi:hypothetical protein
VLDDALSNGKSLLAAGIIKVSGKVQKGDHVKVLNNQNYECARGLSSFSSDEILKIMGIHSKEIEKLLGYVAKSEVIHKDDMVEYKMSQYMNLIGQNARKASSEKINTKKKNNVLKRYALLVDKEKNSILGANKKDVNLAIRKGLKSNLINRLALDEKKLEDIKKSLAKIIKLKDPVDNILEKWARPNGLHISKVTIPIGVVGVIYESRPNVTSDVASLCFKSGNAVILKGGSEALNTNKILAKLFRKSLRENRVNENFIQFIDTKNRKIVDLMLSKMKIILM